MLLSDSFAKMKKLTQTAGAIGGAAASLIRVPTEVKYIFFW